MAGPHATASKVNGLRRVWASRPGLALRAGAGTSVLVAGAGLYAAALAFPLVLHQASLPVLGVALLGTALLLLGLHIRWTRSDGTGR